MKGILVLLKRFGGVGLLDSLPNIRDFNERLQKNAQLSTDLDERLAAMEFDLANQGRVRQLQKREQDDYPHD